MEARTNLESALASIPVANLSELEWIQVGMALKHEGFPVDVWDAWSRNDPRYKPGDCERRWNGFLGKEKPVTAGTIMHMAKERGWMAEKPNYALDWDSWIGSEKEPISTTPMKPTEELRKYLELLFDPDDHVGYVTQDVYEKDGRFVPSKGLYDQTAGELIKSLKKYPDDIGYTIGDWNDAAGAWIRFNALDGNGVKNDNVTKFRHALVESDTLPLDKQEELFRRLRLPITAMVSSGGKSIHAIVKINARDASEYAIRVNYLYTFLSQNGVEIDTQNRNPSRLSRMPGVTRNGKKQELLATNIGCSSWEEWHEYAEGLNDRLPQFVTLDQFVGNPPPLAEELISGILRRGHKMLVSGSSKSGKSFLLMELAIAIAEGTNWLAYPCKKGRVLYVNLEISPESAVNRMIEIYNILGIDPKHANDIIMWNLRGYAEPLDQLVPNLLRRVRGLQLDAIILDPIYKVITGDENNASEMGAFCNQFDRIATETGCAVIYCHHHSKGAQGQKRAMDRASGSGVFARDPDAQLDLIELMLTDDIKNYVADNGATAWRMESSLREFRNTKPLNFWFEYPVHRIDTTGELDALFAEGDPRGNLEKSSNRAKGQNSQQSLESAFNNVQINGRASVKDLAEYANVTEKTVRSWIKNSVLFVFDKGFVFEISGKEKG